jgi:hypothetical protein
MRPNFCQFRFGTVMHFHKAKLGILELGCTRPIGCGMTLAFHAPVSCFGPARESTSVMFSVLESLLQIRAIAKQTEKQ